MSRMQTVLALLFIVLNIHQNIYNSKWWNKYLKVVHVQHPRITGWHIAHFVTHFILARLVPHQSHMLILGGIAWECFEYLYGQVDARGPAYWTSGGVYGQ